MTDLFVDRNKMVAALTASQMRLTPAHHLPLACRWMVIVRWI